jgi:hypothetical protein
MVELDKNVIGTLKMAHDVDGTTASISFELK